VPTENYIKRACHTLHDLIQSRYVNKKYHVIRKNQAVSFLTCGTMHSAVFAVARCLSVCLSVCPSVCHVGSLSPTAEDIGSE